MPLVVFPAPRLDRYIIDAADTRDRVTRPVFRFPFNRGDLQIHGSCVGILLLSVNNMLYACNPCTRRWARLPPLHLSRRIIGFYATGVAGFRCQVLYADLHEPDCRYWILELEANPEARFIDRPGPADALRRANAIAPSHRNPPVYFLDFLCWLTRDGPSTSNILMFDTFDESFSLMPPPPNIRLDGAQLFEMHEHLAIALFSPARVHVWVRDNDSTLWSCMYRISVPVDPNVARPPGVYAVARDRNRLVQSPYILLSDHRIFRPRHTIEESLLLHPSILPFQDTDALDGDPPFFQNQ
jgi:F-box interacting protein